MASVRLTKAAAVPRCSGRLHSAALGDLALRLHLAETEESLVAEVSAGLRSQGLWHALYLVGSAPQRLELRDANLPGALSLCSVLDLEHSDRWQRLLASPCRLEGWSALPLLQVPSELAGGADQLPGLPLSPTWAVLPLRQHGQLLGCLVVLAASLVPADVALLGMLARHLGLAVGRLASLRRTDRSGQDLVAGLVTASSALAAAHSPTSVRRAVLAQLTRLLQSSGAALYEVTTTRRVRCRARSGLLPAWPDGWLASVLTQVAEQWQPYVTLVRARDSAGPVGPVALFVAPLDRTAQVSSMVLVARPESRPFTAAERCQAEALLRQAGWALRRAVRESRLRQQARAWQRHSRLLEAASMVSRTDDERQRLEPRLRAVLQTLVELRLADGGAIMIAGRDGSTAPQLISVGLSDGVVAGLAAWRPGEPVAPPVGVKVFRRSDRLAHLLGIPPLPASGAGRWVVAPLAYQGQVGGWLILIQRTTGRPIQHTLIGSVARYLAAGVIHARHLAAQREAADLSTLLLEVARSLASQVDQERLLATISELTPRLVGATRGLLWRYDEAQGVFSPWHASGLAGEQEAAFNAARVEVDSAPFLDELLRSGRALALDQETDARLPDWLAVLLDIRAMVLAPLSCKGRLLGVIGVDSPGRRTMFDRRDLALVEGVASHAALALDNARLYKQTARRAEQLGSLYETARALSASLALGELLSNIAESAARLVGAEWSTLSLVDQRTGLLVPVRHWPEGELLPSSASAALGSARQAALAGQSVVVHQSDGASASDGQGGPSFCAVACVPLLFQGKVLGSLDVLSRHSASFGADEVRLLEAFGGQAATAIEHARLFQQLADGKRTWEETFDAITDGICVRDGKCRILRANQALARLLGVSVEALIGTRLCEHLPDLEETCCACTGADDEEERLGEATELRVDGVEPRLLSLRDYPVRGAGQAAIRWVTVVKDITLERRMQDALIRAERMRALGEMASGIAHDFNNLLAAILARAELSLLEEPCADGRHAFETIRRAALDGVATVRRIQEYSRVRQDPVGGRVDINEIVQGALDLARHKWKDGPERAGIRIELVLDLHQVPPVVGDPSELREVLMNLIFNAVDAMPEGGQITLCTRVVGDRAIVSVVDTGCGMTEDVQRRIFDPFFTTKGDKGSGLGLAVSYGIIARYGGDIVAQSRPGIGTTMTIRLPLAASGPAEPRSAQDIEASPPPARILLVDDDHHVLESVAELLRRDGHTVSAHTSPVQALADFRATAYDYVITDLGMPEMNGWDLARQLKAVEPDVRVILLTGWRAELTTEQAEARGVSAVLAKPCTLSDLRRVLAAHPPSSAASGGAGARRERRRLSILVVDDQAQFAEALASRLRLQEHAVTVAATGREGLSLVQSQYFDLALVDLRLPDMSGVDVISSLRSAAVPPFVVLMTGLAVSADDEALTTVADAVLPKPWRSEELAQIIERASAR